jgi:hypothetical protein
MRTHFCSLQFAGYNLRSEDLQRRTTMRQAFKDNDAAMTVQRWWRRICATARQLLLARTATLAQRVSGVS